MRILVAIVLCLAPSLVFAEETLLKFKDGSAPMCGNYTEKGNQYCKSVGGGDVCWQKSDIKSVTKVEECEEGGFSAGGAGSGSSSSASAVKSESQITAERAARTKAANEMSIKRGAEERKAWK